MIRYALAVTMFDELELRGFGVPRDVATYGSYDEAYHAATMLAGSLRPLIDDLREAAGADGACLEVRPVEVTADGAMRRYAICLSIELVPGRRPLLWFGA